MAKNKINNNIINIHVEHVERLFSEFSNDENLILNDSFISHFEETYMQAKMKNGSYKINITVNHEPTVEERRRVKNAFKEHYENAVIEDTITLSKYNKHALILLIISVAIFTLLHFLNQMDFEGMFIGEGMLEVLAWVMAWKLIDTLIFYKIETRISRKRNAWARDSEIDVIQKTEPTRNFVTEFRKKFGRPKIWSKK